MSSAQVELNAKTYDSTIKTAGPTYRRASVLRHSVIYSLSDNEVLDFSTFSNLISSFLVISY